MRQALILLFVAGMIGGFTARSPAQDEVEFTPLELGGEPFEEIDEADEIETDRDSFTPATTTAGARRTIVEAAYTFVDNRGVPETHSYPELLVRLGMNEWFEFRLGWNYEVGGASSFFSGNVPGEVIGVPELENGGRLLYGAKAVLTRQDGWKPQSAVIAQGFTPTEGESNDTQLGVVYVFGWILPNEWTWDSAIHYGTSSFEDDDFHVWAPSTVLKIPLGERWKAHSEYFGIFSQDRDDETVQHFISPGAHYLLTPNLELGARVGWGLNEEAPKFFSNVGLGWRF